MTRLLEGKHCRCQIKTHSYPHPLIECNEQVCPKRDGIWFEYCPMHLAAPKLVAELENWHQECLLCRDGKYNEECITAALLKEANGDPK